MLRISSYAETVGGNSCSSSGPVIVSVHGRIILHVAGLERALCFSDTLLIAANVQSRILCVLEAVCATACTGWSPIRAAMRADRYGGALLRLPVPKH